MQSIAIDDLKLAEALLAGERRLLEMVATGEQLADVLHALCNIAEATGSGVHCSILLIDSDAKFHFGAGPSVPPGYARAVEDVPVIPEVGPCGMAASLKRQIVVDDLVADPRWQPLPWHAAAVKFGLRSACSTPRSEEHTSELQSPDHLVCRLLLEKKKRIHRTIVLARARGVIR